MRLMGGDRALARCLGVLGLVFRGVSGVGDLVVWCLCCGEVGWGGAGGIGGSGRCFFCLGVGV